MFVWLPHHAVYVAPADTVDTVNVSTSNFDAEQGMAGGAAVTVLTKSGTNEFHGTGSWLHEDDSLRARNWANSGDKPNTQAQHRHRHAGRSHPQEQAVLLRGLGGALQRRSRARRRGPLPTAAMRAGDFSAFGTTIYDPATGNPDGSGRTPFPNNVIPANRISSIAQQLQSRLPEPNGPGTSSNYTDTGLVDFTPQQLRPQGQLQRQLRRADLGEVQPDERDGVVRHVAGRPSRRRRGRLRLRRRLGHRRHQGEGGDPRHSRGRCHRASSSTETSSFARFDQTCLPPDYGTNYGTDVFGIPGTNGAGGGNGDIRYSGMPGFFISGFEAFGGVDGWTPLFRNDRTYNVSGNATWVKSNHEMRFGLDIVKMELNHWQPELGYPRGYFQFGGGATTLGPTGSPDELQRVRPVPARAHVEREQEPPGRAFHRSRVDVLGLLP